MKTVQEQRLSFELAAKYMSANAANITASGSSVQKGETLIDTAETINDNGYRYSCKCDII